MYIQDIPQLFIKIGYIPANLLFKDNNFPEKIKAAGSIWELHKDAVMPFYSPKGIYFGHVLDKQKK